MSNIVDAIKERIGTDKKRQFDACKLVGVADRFLAEVADFWHPSLKVENTPTASALHYCSSRTSDPGGWCPTAPNESTVVSFSLPKFATGRINVCWWSHRHHRQCNNVVGCEESIELAIKSAVSDYLTQKPSSKNLQ
jgi:hypothetical protein